MEEIQIGEYVRTKYYGIKRIDTIFENRPVNRYGYEIGSDWDGKEYSIIKTTEIVKHSKNIIDLIEEGDYVNGYKVLQIEDSIYKNSKRILIYKNEKEKYERWIYIQEYDGNIHTQDDIETIWTKEQLKTIEYNV